MEKEENMEFKKWLESVWLKTGGVITPAMAAKVLNVTSGRIAQMQKEGKLKALTGSDGKTYLSLSEVIAIQEKRKA